MGSPLHSAGSGLHPYPIMDLDLEVLKRQLQSEQIKNELLAGMVKRHESFLRELHGFATNKNDGTKLKLMYDDLMSLYGPSFERQENQ